MKSRSDRRFDIKSKLAAIIVMSVCLSVTLIAGAANFLVLAETGSNVPAAVAAGLISALLWAAGTAYGAITANKRVSVSLAAYWTVSLAGYAAVAVIEAGGHTAEGVGAIFCLFASWPAFSLNSAVSLLGLKPGANTAINMIYYLAVIVANVIIMIKLLCRDKNRKAAGEN